MASEAWAADSVTVTLEQQWFLADGSSAPLPEDAATGGPVWQIPLLVASSTSMSEKAVIMDQKVPSPTTRTTITYYTLSKDAHTIVPAVVAVVIALQVQNFTIPLAGAGDWVKINTGQQALVRVAHSPEMMQRLQPALRSQALSPVDRAALLNDAYALAKVSEPN